MLAEAGVLVERPAADLETVERSADGQPFRFCLNHAELDQIVTVTGRELLTDRDTAGELVVPAGRTRVVRLTL